MKQADRHVWAVEIAEHVLLDLLDWRKHSFLRLPDLSHARPCGWDVDSSKDFAIPEDAVIQWVYPDPKNKVFLAYISHPSFPVWHDGDWAPRARLVNYHLMPLREGQTLGEAADADEPVKVEYGEPR